jgi:hypothetical protein
MTTCNECETVAHCLKHGCMPKVRSTIDMARKAGGRAQQNKNCDVEYVMSAESIQRLIESVRADEREACAKVCESLPMQQDVDVRDQAAAAIRVRGQA